MDLRKNGGGSLPEAISLTGLFVDTGPIVQVKDSAGNVQHYDDLDRGVAWSGPLVVLCSKFIASRARSLRSDSGLLPRHHHRRQDNARQRTVQSLLDLGQRFFRTANPPKFGSLKITMQSSIAQTAIARRIAVWCRTSNCRASQRTWMSAESDLDFALAFDQVPAVPIRKDNLVDAKTIEELKAPAANASPRAKSSPRNLRKIDKY